MKHDSITGSLWPESLLVPSKIVRCRLGIIEAKQAIQTPIDINKEIEDIITILEKMEE